MNIAKPGDIQRFWFEELAPRQWWTKDRALDAAIRSRFGATHASAATCELFGWRESAPGRLAEVIVLDQFSRNIHRGDPRAFASDPLALALAQEAVFTGTDRELPVERRAFLYMPFMHSESALIHEWSIRLFVALGVEANLESALRHQAVIERFGRFPHRNAALGRTSTPQELEFLAGKQSIS